MKDVNLNILFTPTGFPLGEANKNVKSYRGIVNLIYLYRGINVLHFPLVLAVKKVKLDSVGSLWVDREIVVNVPKEEYQEGWQRNIGFLKKDYKENRYSIYVGITSKPFLRFYIKQDSSIDYTIPARKFVEDEFQGFSNLNVLYEKQNFSDFLYEHRSILGQKIIENIKIQESLCQPNFFKDLPDIKIELSDFFTVEELKEIYNKVAFVFSGDFDGSSLLKPENFPEVPFLGRYPYGISVNTFKSILLEYFGENNPNGIKGLNKEFLKVYKYNSELLYLLRFLGYLDFTYLCAYNKLQNNEERKYHHYFFWSRKYISQINMPDYILDGPLCFPRILKETYYCWLYRGFLRRLKIIAKF